MIMIDLGELIKTINAEDEKGVGGDELVENLINKALEDTKDSREKFVKDFIECHKATEEKFQRNGERYHFGIEGIIDRTLSPKEKELVNIAYGLAFMDGWFAHKKRSIEHDK